MSGEQFQLAMFILAPIVLLIDAILVTTGIFRKLVRKEKENESERAQLFSIIEIMEKIGIVFGVLTLILAGYLAINLPKVNADWIYVFNPFTILVMVIIGSLMTLRMLEDTPIVAAIALLAGFLGAGLIALFFEGDIGNSKWIYVGLFFGIDLAAFLALRLLTKQMAMIGKILNWFPIALIVSFTSLGWGIVQIVLLIIHGIQLAGLT